MARPAHAHARELPKARVEVLADAGHAPMIESAEAVNRLIRDLVVDGGERAMR